MNAAYITVYRQAWQVLKLTIQNRSPLTIQAKVPLLDRRTSYSCLASWLSSLLWLLYVVCILHIVIYCVTFFIYFFSPVLSQHEGHVSLSERRTNPYLWERLMPVVVLPSHEKRQPQPVGNPFKSRCRRLGQRALLKPGTFCKSRRQKGSRQYVQVQDANE